MRALRHGCLFRDMRSVEVELIEGMIEWDCACISHVRCARPRDVQGFRERSHFFNERPVGYWRSMRSMRKGEGGGGTSEMKQESQARHGWIDHFYLLPLTVQPEKSSADGGVSRVYEYSRSSIALLSQPIGIRDESVK